MQAQQLDLEKFEKYDYQGDLPKILTKGEVYSVRVLIKQSKTKDVPMFVREHLLHQETLFKKFLAGEPFSPGQNKYERQTLYVTGPPGCGKTVFTTLLAHRHAAGRLFSSDAKPKRVLMILFRKQVRCEILIINGENTERLRWGVKMKDIEGSVEEILSDERIPSFDLCIVDGIQQGIGECSQLMSTLDVFAGESNKIQRVVYTTSLQFSFNGGEVDQGSDRDHEQISFDSFTKDDYDSAIANENFVRHLLESKPNFMNDILYLKQNGKIKLEDQDDNNPRSDLSVEEFLQKNENVAAARKYITEKYLYAGGSARFMFEYTTSELEKRLRGLFDKLQTNDWGAFANSALAPSATSSVNSLMQQLNGRATAVSRYVLFEAYDKVEGDLVKAVQAAADMSKNPVLEGWVFELRQLHTVKKVLTNNSQDNRSKKSLKSKEGLFFQPVSEASFDGKKLTKEKEVDVKSGTIIWCMKWNQGCFDVAFFKNDTLMTLQFTLARSHSLKLQYIRDLKNAIENCSGTSVGSVIHVGVVSNDNVQGFNFVDIEGAGRGGSTWTSDFTVKTYKSSELEVAAMQDDCFETSCPCGQHDVNTKKRRLESE